MTTITTNTAPSHLKQLFDVWLELWKPDVPEDELKRLFPLLENIGKTTEGEGRLPFAVIARTPALTLARRMEKVVLGGNTGRSYISDNRVSHLDVIPEGHYLMWDIEDGRAMRNIKPSVATEQLRCDKRFGGTTEEGPAVAMKDSLVLRHHYMDLVGSRYDSDGLPCLCELGVRPELFAVRDDGALPRSGSLSCGGRLGLGA